MKKLAIVGVVGVPAQYGGFETLVDNLLNHIDNKLKITIYCSKKIYRQRLKYYKKAGLVYLPFNANGFQSILYDFFSIIHSTFSNDLVLILGISGAIGIPVVRLFFRKKVLIVNIDGLEWKREKWGHLAKIYLYFSEMLAVKFSSIVVVDNIVISKYIKNKYRKNGHLIEYGGDNALEVPLCRNLIDEYDIDKQNYCFTVCRIEPENNLHIILEAFSFLTIKFIAVGNWENTKYGRNLKSLYSNFSNIYLLESIYEPKKLNALRSNCFIYVHGHSAGGTNPSLVEAMTLGLPIVAYDVNYNRETTKNKALYFKNKKELIKILKSVKTQELKRISKDMKAIANEFYTWSKISEKYISLF